ncbi:MAG: hypothetical protein U9N14_04870, partial [Pseudomonadota bacterium]|nr:hypothetical protein [Pseudomonadota bacterium]
MNRSQEYVEQVRIYLEDSRVKLQMSEDFEDANCLNHWNGGGAGGGSGVRSTATQKNGEASLLVATNAALNDAWAQQSITAFTTNPGILVMSAWAATQIALDDLKITFNLDVMSPPYFYRPYIQ